MVESSFRKNIITQTEQICGDSPKQCNDPLSEEAIHSRAVAESLDGNAMSLPGCNSSTNSTENGEMVDKAPAASNETRSSRTFQWNLKCIQAVRKLRHVLGMNDARLYSEMDVMEATWGFVRSHAHAHANGSTQQH